MNNFNTLVTGSASRPESDMWAILVTTVSQLQTYTLIASIWADKCIENGPRCDEDQKDCGGAASEFREACEHDSSRSETLTRSAATITR